MLAITHSVEAGPDRQSIAGSHGLSELYDVCDHSSLREVYKFLSSFQSSWVTACFLVLGSKELADPKGLASNGAELSVVS